MLENLETFARESFTDEQRAAFASFVKDASTMLDDEEDMCYRPFIMALDILSAILED